MSRVRHAALRGVLAVSLLALAACGSNSDDEQEGTATLSSVSVSGDQGKKPKVTFDGRLDGTKSETDVLIEGDGDEVAAGDTVKAQWWIGNGYTEDETDSTYGGAPQSFVVDSDKLPFLTDLIVGNQVGDRIVAMMPADTAFGEGGGVQFNIGNRDATLIVLDILGRSDTVPPLDGPQGEEKTPAGWAPSLIEKDGVITGLDFSTAHKPSGQLIATTLIKGDGAKVKTGQTITVNYLGQVYNADAPFDESYSAQPAEFPIGVPDGVIDGWNERLIGRTVGSRVILEVPPDKGYGEAGEPSVGIKGTDTLFFVVDILGAS